MSEGNKSGKHPATTRRVGVCRRSHLAAPLLSVALLVAVAGPVSATSDDEAPLVVSADQSGSLGVVSTAQSDTEISPESDTERRLVGRESSERVDGVVIALWSIAAGMTVMLVVFLWHTSPRRRLRLARRRSTQLYDGEADRAEDGAGAGTAGDAEVVDNGAAAAEAARQDAEAVEVAASGADEDLPPAEAVPPTAWEEPVAAGSKDEDEAEAEPEVDEDQADAEPEVDEDDAGVEPQPVQGDAGAEPQPVGEDSGPAESVLPTAWEEPDVAESELPPVWEGGDELAGDAAEPDESGPANEPPAAQRAADEGRPGYWMQLRRTLGLD